MSFWTGLEAFTGHRPGAFTGMTMKDLFDKDMWDRMPRTWSGQRMPTGPTDIRTGRAGEPMMTNWARGGGGQTPTSVPQPAFSSPMQPEGALAGPSQYPQVSALPESNITSRPIPTNPYKRDWRPGMSQIGGNTVPTMYHPYMFGQRPDQMGAAQWNPLNRRMQQSKLDQQGLTTAGQYRAGLQDAVGTLGDAFLPKNVMAQGREMWGDLRDHYYPGKDASNPQYDSTMQQMADMTTVKKITDDASPNTITQTIKQQVPANPTKTLMNMNQPGFLEKLGTGIGEQWSNLWDGSVLRHGAGAWDAMKDLSRKRHEEEMLRRQRGY